jgi:hypothetical protein
MSIATLAQTLFTLTRGVDSVDPTGGISRAWSAVGTFLGYAYSGLPTDIEEFDREGVRNNVTVITGTNTGAENGDVLTWAGNPLRVKRQRAMTSPGQTYKSVYVIECLEMSPPDS